MNKLLLNTCMAFMLLANAHAQDKNSDIGSLRNKTFVFGQDVKLAHPIIIDPDDARPLSEILDKAGVPVAVKSSVYNVEAHLHKGKDFDVLVVANWSGVPKDVELVVRGGSYSSAEVYNSASAAVKSAKDGSVTVCSSFRKLTATSKVSSARS